MKTRYRWRGLSKGQVSARSADSADLPAAFSWNGDRPSASGAAHSHLVNSELTSACHARGEQGIHRWCLSWPQPRMTPGLRASQCECLSQQPEKLKWMKRRDCKITTYSVLTMELSVEAQHATTSWLDSEKERVPLEKRRSCKPSSVRPLFFPCQRTSVVVWSGRGSHALLLFELLYDTSTHVL